MANIRTRFNNSKHLHKGFVDDHTLCFEIFDKRRLRLIKIKVLCDAFDDVMSHEVFVDDVSFLKVTYNPEAAEPYEIEYNKEFRGGE